MPDLTPQRQLVQTPMTPIIGDVLVAISQNYDRASVPAYGTKMADIHHAGKEDRFKNHVLTFAAPEVEARQAIFTLYFAAPRENQDTYAWEATQADIGGNKFDAVQRTYVIPRTSYKMTEPLMGSVMPATPEDKFPGTYILAAKAQQRLPKELDGYFVAETHTYVRKATITNLAADPLNGLPLASITTIYHKDEVVPGAAVTAAQLFALTSSSFWGTQATGYSNSGRQLSTEFYEITEEQLVGGTASGGSILIADYFTTENYAWPAVLTSIESSQFDLIAGGTEFYPWPNFLRQYYNGPCRARVTLRWSVGQFAVDTPSVMLPRSVHLNTPFYSVSVEPCLHGQLVFPISINDHPKYEDVSGQLTWSATIPTDWPASITASSEQKPYRGGWLYTLVEIYRPSYA